MSKISVVVGGQFGSEGKGAIAGYLASEAQNTDMFDSADGVCCVRVGGPNAGHTVLGRCPEGCDYSSHADDADDSSLNMLCRHPWRLRHIPVAAVTNPRAILYIAAGSEVDFDVLRSEINELNSAGYQIDGRLFVNRNATVLEPSHIKTEAESDLTARLGSTSKGIGAARADRIWRKAATVGSWPGEFPFQVVDDGFVSGIIRSPSHIVIEGTQGYGLGLHTEFYPFATSGDVTAVDVLAQAGISPWAQGVNKLDVWVVARMNPIRVAGNSGPLMEETSWDELGLPAELTTVTRKTRRVGEFDMQLLAKAVRANGGPARNVRIALTMVDHRYPNLRDVTNFRDASRLDVNRLSEFVYAVQVRTGAQVALVGTGPDSVADVR